MEYQTVYKTVNGKVVATREELTPFHAYELTYSDGDTQTVEIRKGLADATAYYVGQSFGYWCGASNTEKQHTVTGIKEI